MKSVGIIRFIGELFNQQILTAYIMIRCLKHLLSEGDEKSLECLCILITTIGRELEKKQSLIHYFVKMEELSMKRGEISNRVRFMLQDVVELRNRNWKPRRDDSAERLSIKFRKKLKRKPQGARCHKGRLPPIAETYELEEAKTQETPLAYAADNKVPTRELKPTKNAAH
uniref:MIF4G domain-containing protein n=1 Tax=Timema tahoe TaxID=61484 RepID=A0A7R9IA02_9NEOP|nr:unnamed protein product [Timema tahoe]